MLFPNHFSKKYFLALLASLGTLALAIPASRADSVVTDPVGFTSVSCLSNSDTLANIPFTRPQAFVGSISSISGSTLTLSGSPNWTANQFVYAKGSQPNHYYALLGSSGVTNPKEGRTFPVTANTTDTLTVDTTGDVLTAVPTGTQVILIPYWTLATVFPASDADVSFTATTFTRTLKTEILIPNYVAGGINPSSSVVYFFSNNVNSDPNNGIGWRVVGDNVTDHGDDVLVPDGFFTVRNLNSAPTLPLTSIGAVLTKKVAVPELTSSTKAVDNSVSMIRPLSVALNSTGLNPADGSFVTTTSTRSLQDQLLVFNNTIAALNKSPSAIYIYGSNINGDSGNGVGWRLVGDNASDHGDDQIPAGSAMVIRKAANATGQPIYWKNSPTY